MKFCFFSRRRNSRFAGKNGVSPEKFKVRRKFTEKSGKNIYHRSSHYKQHSWRWLHEKKSYYSRNWRCNFQKSRVTKRVGISLNPWKFADNKLNYNVTLPKCMENLRDQWKFADSRVVFFNSRTNFFFLFLRISPTLSDKTEVLYPGVNDIWRYWTTWPACRFHENRTTLTMETTQMQVARRRVTENDFPADFPGKSATFASLIVSHRTASYGIIIICMNFIVYYNYNVSYLIVRHRTT